MPADVTLPIRSEADIVAARRTGRDLAEQVGFTRTQNTLIATAISELARNIIKYARHGEIQLVAVEQGGRRGLTVRASDQGPGIPDLELAMQDGYSTGSGLGLGLPGARRLMDDFSIESNPGQGTRVVATKWAR